MRKIIVGYGNLKKFEIYQNSNLTFILGPCAIESRDHSFFMAEKVSNICKKISALLNIN